MAISKRLRYEILRRDDHSCRYCGSRAPEVKLTVDHVVPVALGGTDDPTNLAAACADCNAGKSSTPPDSPIVEDVAADALRWSKAMELASQMLVTQQREEHNLVADWLEEWQKWSDLDYLPVDFSDSIKRFSTAGLPMAVLKENAFRATGARHVARRNQFRYFCGICHNQIREMQENARALVAEEAPADGA